LKHFQNSTAQPKIINQPKTDWKQHTRQNGMQYIHVNVACESIYVKFPSTSVTSEEKQQISLAVSETVNYYGNLM